MLQRLRGRGPAEGIQPGADPSEIGARRREPGSGGRAFARGRARRPVRQDGAAASCTGPAGDLREWLGRAGTAAVAAGVARSGRLGSRLGGGVGIPDHGADRVTASRPGSPGQQHRDEKRLHTEHVHRSTRPDSSRPPLRCRFAGFGSLRPSDATAAGCPIHSVGAAARSSSAWGSARDRASFPAVVVQTSRRDLEPCPESGWGRACAAPVRGSRPRGR